MAQDITTIKTRIQLKSDTEENWRKTVLASDHQRGLKASGTSFVPLKGELIIFEPDSNHPYSRLKIGTGNPSDNVLQLPFIDAGTLNGEETEIAKYTNFESFPSPGLSNKLYIDLSTNRIYHYSNTSGYSQLSNFNFSATTTSISGIGSWDSGVMTSASISENTLIIINGIAPYLTRDQRQVVTGIIKE